MKIKLSTFLLVFLLFVFHQTKENDKKQLNIKSKGYSSKRTCPIIPKVRKSFNLEKFERVDEIAEYSFNLHFYYPPSLRSLLLFDEEREESQGEKDDCNVFENIMFSLMKSASKKHKIFSFGMNEVSRTLWEDKKSPLSTMSVGMNNEMYEFEEEVWEENENIGYEQASFIEVKIHENERNRNSILRIYSDGVFELIPFFGKYSSKDAMPDDYQVNFVIGPLYESKIRENHPIESIFTQSLAENGFALRIKYKDSVITRINYIWNEGTPQISVNSVFDSRKLFGHSDFFNLGLKYSGKSKYFKKELVNGDVKGSGVSVNLDEVMPSNNTNSEESENYCFCDESISSTTKIAYYGPCLCLFSFEDIGYKSSFVEQFVLDIVAGIFYLSILVCLVMVVGISVYCLRSNKSVRNSCKFGSRGDTFCFLCRLGCFSGFLQVIKVCFSVSQLVLVYTVNIRIYYGEMKTLFFFQTTFLFLTVFLEESLDAFDLCSRSSKNFCCSFCRKIFFTSWNITLQVWALIALDCIYFFGHIDAFYDMLKVALFFQLLNFLLEMGLLLIEIERFLCFRRGKNLQSTGDMEEEEEGKNVINVELKEEEKNETEFQKKQSTSFAPTKVDLEDEIGEEVLMIEEKGESRKVVDVLLSNEYEKTDSEPSDATGLNELENEEDGEEIILGIEKEKLDEVIEKSELEDKKEQKITIIEL